MDLFMVVQIDNQDRSGKLGQWFVKAQGSLFSDQEIIDEILWKFLLCKCFQFYIQFHLQLEIDFLISSIGFEGKSYFHTDAIEVGY